MPVGARRVRPGRHRRRAGHARRLVALTLTVALCAAASAALQAAAPSAARAAGPGLEISTVTSPGDFALPSESVEYTITVTNTGTTPYTDADPATFTDDLSGVVDDAFFNQFIPVSASGGTATADSSTIDWHGPLAVGASAVVTFTVDVFNVSFQGGDLLLTNSITGPPESNCAARCTTSLPVKTYEITKTVSPNTDLVAGATETYTVRVHNNGHIAYTDADPATFTDDLSEVLALATFVPGSVSATAGTVDDSALPELTWSGPLAVGATATVTYSVVIDDPVEPDAFIINWITGPPGLTCTDDPAGCATITPLRYLGLDKHADVSGPIVAGTTVTYEVDATNFGRTDYTASHPASFTDDLSGVLNHARLVSTHASVGTVDTTRLPALTWSAPLAINAEATITYTVMVTDHNAGELVNELTGPNVSNCSPYDGTIAGLSVPEIGRTLLGGGFGGRCALSLAIEPSPPGPGPGTGTEPLPFPSGTVPVATQGQLPFTGADLAGAGPLAALLLLLGGSVAAFGGRRGPLRRRVQQ